MAIQSSARSTDSNKLSRAQTITKQARMIFSAYRTADFADPDGFILQLGLVLERYSEEVAAAVSSPFTGIQRTLKRPPVIADIVEACDREAERLEGIKRLSQYKTAPYERLVEQNLGVVFVPPHAPQYSAMVERSKTASDREWRRDVDRPGIWVPLSWLEQSSKGVTFRRPIGAFEVDGRTATYKG